MPSQCSLAAGAWLLRVVVLALACMTSLASSLTASQLLHSQVPSQSDWQPFGGRGPRAGSGVVRIDPVCFLAGCRTRRLNQAPVVLSRN